MSDFLIQDGQTVVYAGDSITDCGRMGDQRPLGNGYAMLTTELIRARYPERSIKFHNVGISGNTVQNLRDRWEDDVINYKPDWVTIKIGINDLARTLYQTPEATPPDVYEVAYRDILTRTKKTSAKICLIDPFIYLWTRTKAASANVFSISCRNISTSFTNWLKNSKRCTCPPTTYSCASFKTALPKTSGRNRSTPTPAGIWSSRMDCFQL